MTWLDESVPNVCVHVYRDLVDPINVHFCFDDDPDFATDADRDSRILQAWH